MSKKQQKEQAIFFMIFCYVSAIVLVAAGYLWGAVLLIPGFMLTVSLFPGVLDFMKSVAEGLGDLRKRNQRVSTETSTKTAENQMSATPAVTRPSDVSDLISDIQDFRPYKRPRNEGELESLLMQHLRTNRPSLRTQLQYERTQIDAQIDGIGIEVKYQPNEADFDRLFGQIEKYLRHLSYIVVVIGYERSAESTVEFTKRIRNHSWDDRVFVVVK